MEGASYSEASVGSFLEKLSSADPEPGGGGAAALAGALAAALVSMVTNLTLGKEKFAGLEAEVTELRTASEKLRAELTELITGDALAYGKVAAAMKLPRDTEAQKEERRQVLQAALRGAAETPLRVAEAATEVARLSLPAAEKGNPNAVSDAGVAVVMADAAAQSAALNVKINLAWIEDEAFKQEVWSRIESALSETAHLRVAVLALTYSKI
jgi:formiminotetrahydrofolate cyclodeaminase